MAKFTSSSSRLATTLRKPRNPHVAPSLQRVAGRHGPGAGARRQQAVRALQRELQRYDESSP